MLVRFTVAYTKKMKKKLINLLCVEFTAVRTKKKTKTKSTTFELSVEFTVVLSKF